MRLLFRLAALLLLPGLSIGANARVHSCGTHHYPDSVARTFTSDSVRRLLEPYRGPQEGSYAVRPEFWRPVFRKLRRFSDLVIFKENGEALQLRLRHRCENMSLLLANTLPFATDTSRFLPDLFPMFAQIDGPPLVRNTFTAVIFWNRSLGMTEEDCPFEWARQLRQKFDTGIQIVWVNTDVNAEGDEATTARNLQTISSVLSQIDRLYY